MSVALLTFLGIALHDTKIDSMTSFAIALPIVVATYEGAHLLLAHEAHTHVERVNVNAVAGRYTAQLPRLRNDDSKKYRLDRGLGKSGHQFDGYLLPA